jgi:hypothetical protein
LENESKTLEEQIQETQQQIEQISPETKDAPAEPVTFETQVENEFHKDSEADENFDVVIKEDDWP